MGTLTARRRLAIERLLSARYSGVKLNPRTYAADAKVILNMDGGGENMKREPNGKFAEGNKGGPGRPKRVTERAYLDIIISECPPDTWREIVQAAVRDARTGDAKAREWLASFLIGKPDGVAPTLHKLAVDELAGLPEFSEMDIMTAKLAGGI